MSSAKLGLAWRLSEISGQHAEPLARADWSCRRRRGRGCQSRGTLAVAFEQVGPALKGSASGQVKALVAAAGANFNKQIKELRQQARVRFGRA